MSEQVEDVVRAKRFELVDEEGHARAKLFSTNDGAVAFSLYGAGGDTARATVAVTTAGLAVLNLHDGSGKTRVTLQAAPDEAKAQISLTDEVGRARVQVGLDQDGGAGIVMLDQWGHRRTTLNVTPEGEPILAFFDEDAAPIGGFLNGQFADKEGGTR